jgi:diaminohydroxyphosphoribosylaminopyrimidine deaminase/5-amino-6-(5-phosphoribosylamino)uracil reductase
VIIGRGVTAVSGRPHAETQALAEAGEKARGATVYVTLEPCSHHGKTPPCAEALIAAGVGRVVVALTDPDPRVSGRGLGMLGAAGIEVVANVLDEAADSELEAYLKRQRNKRPQVILKLAVSADGMIGKKGTGQVAITGREARAQSHILRAECDAILIGIGTALADDPELTSRLPGLEQRTPLRIVLDGQLRLPPRGKLVRSAAPGHPLLVVTGEGYDVPGDMVKEGIEILRIAGPDRLAALLESLGARGISSLVVEGGAIVARAFLSADLVDRIMLFSSDKIIGEGGIASPVNLSAIPDGFELDGHYMFGDDHLRQYRKV